MFWTSEVLDGPYVLVVRKFWTVRMFWTVRKFWTVRNRARFRARVQNLTPTAPPRLGFSASLPSCVQARFGILVDYSFHMSPGFRTAPDSEIESGTRFDNAFAAEIQRQLSIVRSS